ncbi:hypothetical protein ACIL82_10790 [Enterococcus faecium]
MIKSKKKRTVTVRFFFVHPVDVSLFVFQEYAKCYKNVPIVDKRIGELVSFVFGKDFAEVFCCSLATVAVLVACGASLVAD